MGSTWGQLGPTWTNLGHHAPTWGQLGANLGPTWGPLGPTWGNMRPTWSQLGVHLGPTRANLGELGLTRSPLRPARANMSQPGPTWGQPKPIMDEKIIEKPLFFLSFFDISRISLETLGSAVGDPLGTPWGALGNAWGALGDAWGSLGDALGSLGDALGGLGDALGDPSWRTLGKPGKNHLERPPQNPRRT